MPCNQLQGLSCLVKTPALRRILHLSLGRGTSPNFECGTAKFQRAVGLVLPLLAVVASMPTSNTAFDVSFSGMRVQSHLPSPIPLSAGCPATSGPLQRARLLSSLRLHCQPACLNGLVACACPAHSHPHALTGCTYFPQIWICDRCR